MFEDDSNWKKEQQSIKPLKQNKRLNPIKSSSSQKQMSMLNPREHKETYDLILDLHGKTLDESFKHVSDTVKYSVLTNKKSLLIITGKGNTEKSNTIQQELPRWLDLTELSQHVVSHKFAPAKKGGDGARVVNLRKRNSF